MRVLQTLRTLERGGAETLVLDICQRAKANDLDLTMATLYGGSMEEDFRKTDVDFIHLQKRKGRDLRMIYRLRKLIKERGIQIVHTNQPAEAFYSHFACLGTKAKVIMTYHGFVVDSKLLIRTLNFLIPRLSANVFCSKYMVKYYAGRESLKPLQNIRVVYNGVNPERLKPTGKSIKAELGLTDKNKLMGMIGNFRSDKTKDQMTICRALPEVFEKDADAHFVFVGNPVFLDSNEEFEKCVRYCEEKGIADRVHFLGLRFDVEDILSNLDLFVFSSMHEGMPLAVIEAMLSNVPLILTDIEPVLEVTDNGKLAEIFPVGDEKFLAEKILKYLNNEDLRRDMAERAFRYAEKNFTIDAHIANLKELYQSLL